jgi:poly(3-hydroxybutyrate) depolymerase
MTMLFDFNVETIGDRYFLWKMPPNTTPENGYPVLFLAHGAAQHPFSWFIGLNAWGKEQTSFALAALERGFLIIAPASQRPIQYGPRAWDAFTNNLTDSKDLQFFHDMLIWIETINTPINWDAVYCAGFSSGAFMASRIAHASGDRFAGIIVHSGANAEAMTLTERGPVFDCNSSYEFPVNHPPTLIVHGGSDQFVPSECGLHYYDELVRNGFDATLLFDPTGGHIWLSDFNEGILDWIDLHIK